jgi:glyoxylase-like metal-dependent hydrolase (beta-lactamase superfamily II)
VLGRPTYWTAAYWADGLLIDTGSPRAAHEFLAALGDLRIERIVNTHHHEDHVGANALLQQRYSVPILAPTLTLPYLADPRLLRLQPYRVFFWGWPEPCQAEPLGDVVETSRHRFEVIPTPGHSPDHVSFYEPNEGWLFAGDAYVGGRDKVLRPDSDIGAIIASLKLLRSRPAQRMFPGSGNAVSDPAEALGRKIAYFEELDEQVRAMHCDGRTPPQIARQLLGPTPFITYVTMGHFTTTNLVKSYLISFHQAHPGAR